MGYASEGDLENLYREDFVDEAGKAMTEAVGDRFRQRVEFRTPVAKIPAAYRGNYGEWIYDRDGRRPRTLRDSWYREPVEKTGEGHSVGVATDDPVGPHVEWDTRPHSIRAKMRVDPRTGELRQGALRFPMGPTFLYRVEVWHPGTQGRHMMRDTAIEMSARWPEVAEQKLAELARVENRRR